MENKEKNEGGFNVHVYSPGNLFANNITFEAPVYFGSGSNRTEQYGYTDEQIAQALEAVCGEGKPVDEKRKWAAVYWCLRWYCNFPVKGSDFCERIKKLPFSKDPVPECDYNNIRRLVVLSFMGQDARQLDKVKASQGDEKFLAECKVVVVALAQELGKSVLPTL